MPVLRINDRQHALGSGTTRLGGGSDVDIRVTDDEQIGTQAVIDLSDGHAVIRRSGDARVKVNGVVLGAEPTPLMHGDKIEIAGSELFYSEDTKQGSTRHVAQSDVKPILEKRAGASRATTGSGGRLVSLVDGKEYMISERGLTIGRDASSDVVVAQNEVSRRHAEIVASERGYLLHDYSTNGVHVNGVRVLQSQVLSRSDVVRVGTEEFRFYADVIISGTMPAASMPKVAPPVAVAPQASAKSADAPAQTAVASRPPTPAPVQAPVAPPPSAKPGVAAPVGAGADITHRVAAVPDEVATPPTVATPDTRPVLAVLEVINEGVLKGKRYELRVPLAHVGRGAHNDVPIDDDSVSDMHAKLQRREDGWYLSDLGSTNGTYVGGSRLTSERRLDGVPDVRFGNVKLTFRSADIKPPPAKGTRAIASMQVDRSKLPARDQRTSAPAKPAAAKSAPTTPERAGPSVLLWILILIALAAVAFYLLKS